MRVALGVVLALAAACGEGPNKKIPDGPPPPDGDVPLQPVTITITRGATARAGVVVLFQNADSSVVSRAMTDASGVASAQMTGGGFVTAINPFADTPPTGVDGNDLRTFAGVKAGDQLKLHEPAEPAQLDVMFRVPTDPDAQSYHLQTTCGSQDITNGSGGGTYGSGSGGPPGGVVSLYGCGATIDLVVEVRGAGGVLLKTIVRTNVAVTAGGTVDLMNEQYADAAVQPFTYTNLPGGFTTVNVTYSMVTAKGPLFEQEAAADVTAGAAQAMVSRPNVPGATAVTSTQFFNGSSGRHYVVDWGPAGAYAFDTPGVFLREYTAFPQFDVAAHKFTWTTSGGAQPDLVSAEVTFQRPDGKGALIWNWEISSPYTDDSLVFPVLPAEHGDLNTKENDSASLERFSTLKVPGGYDAIRPTALTDARGFQPGTSGRAVIVEPVEATPTELR